MQAKFSKWFSWLLPARMRTKQSTLLPAPVPQQQLPAVARAQQDVKHLVGVADATISPPRDVRRIVSLGRQAPVQGPDAYELVRAYGQQVPTVFLQHCSLAPFQYDVLTETHLTRWGSLGPTGSRAA